MALLAGKKLSLIKLISKQSCFKHGAALGSAFTHSNLNRYPQKSLLFTVNDQQFRNTSTTTKKGNVFAFNELNLNSFDQLHKNKRIDLSFEDSEAAFKSKTNFELLRGFLVFQLCGIKFLLDNQKMLLDTSRLLLGKNLFGILMKKTFYGHFVAGENQDEIRGNVEAMRHYGVKSILDYSAEEDLESNHSAKSQNTNHISGNRKIYDPSEIQCEKNLKIFMDCINTVENVTEATGLAAIKITSLIRPALLLKYSSLIDQILKHDKENVENKIDPDIFRIGSLLQMTDEEFARHFNNIPQLNQANAENIIFSPNELGELRNMFVRLDELANHALKKKCRMFVDAEQTYFQGAIHRVTVELMREFNKSQCTVMNTYQNYLKNAYNSLEQDLEQARKEGYRFGAKLVRGAYMEQERERASKMGYEDPVNESYDATTKMYEKSFLHCLEEIKKNPGFVNIMVASHNEDTVRFAVEKMEEYGVRPNDDSVFFGQLYGMCDFITFSLGGVGYSAFKYVPYGPVDEVLPYLSRRATENGKGVFEKMEKEKRLIKNEMKRRFLNLEFI